ncbi:MAG: hypothetical protein QF594_00740 [Dehalococcoidales bacterium]|jgi:epoxyqueuosine reductase QueG|nr:hypothetical protein [Dehalococcoidales bacterium]
MEVAQLIQDSIKEFANTNPLNIMSQVDNHRIYDGPLVQFADGDDPIFTEYKTIIDSRHLTPREVLAKSFGRNPHDFLNVSVISWILPITSRTRESNRRRKQTPSRRWGYTRTYRGLFLKALRECIVELVSDMGYLAVAPLAAPYYKKNLEEGVMVSNWSERHVAYAAGLGTFSLTGALITEKGMAVRCDSIVTDLALPVNPRTTQDPFSNCLFYVNGSCKVCVQRCPSGALSEKGLNKKICWDYININLVPLREVYGVERTGCGLCQTGVPCEFRNPVRNKGKTVNQTRVVNVRHT